MRIHKPKPVTEYQARGEIERVYHEIRQVLRVNGVNLNFRTWAGYGDFLPLMWDALRPNAETRAFENASDDIRAVSVRAAAGLGKLNARARVRLGESQAYQVRKALDLYHYINPKLLLLTSAVYLAVTVEAELNKEAEHGEGLDLLQRGVPANMYPMEMVPEKPRDKRLAELFKDIKKTLSLSSINSDYRTLALWPEYLSAGWESLKPVVQRSEYEGASNNLRELSRNLARKLPYPVNLSREAISAIDQDADEMIKTAESFERLLPSLIINIALFELDWAEPEMLAKSPFPVPATPMHTIPTRTENEVARVSIQTAAS